MTDENILTQILSFLSEIGIPYNFGEVPEEKEFLPGLCIQNAGLTIDQKALKYPGDILHEAGHLAVAAPSRRRLMDGKLSSDTDMDMGEEMMAIAWSYAAAVHLGIDPHIVFHADGYKGGGSSIVENFTNRQFFGVSLLQWTRMAFDDRNAIENGAEPFPVMQKWVREFEVTEIIQ